ncbi:Uncharacterized [Moorella glycerini]|uniref:Uncharacterized protein n=1 Tax=Neomoorella stamsii TaxID=1266720 RepID=A0A9X7P4X1_9FIRM|nr:MULTISPECIES: hypothetical protein [Moorella]PRR69615.1 hypothetical protein MOST_30370 [Moorella stamsii]CEP67861.1 Uncharacterized [Moorella glycerini]CEP68731.1 Uncharacterized [Moorella glycerini]
MERKPKIAPEEDARRYNLWQQGYTDSQIAKLVGCPPGSIKSWREARGLPPNRMPANNRNFRRGTGDWEFAPGDRIKVGIKHGMGINKHMDWCTGVIYAVYRRFIVVQLPRYKVTVSQWELKDGTVKIEMLARKAG